MTKDEWLNSLDRESFNKKREELKAMIFSETFRGAVAEVLREDKLSVETFHSMDFTTEAGIHKAIRHQGRIDGVIQFLDQLYGLTEGDENGG